MHDNAPMQWVNNREAGKAMIESRKKMFEQKRSVYKKRAGGRDHLRCVINVTHEKTYNDFYVVSCSTTIIVCCVAHLYCSNSIRQKGIPHFFTQQFLVAM